MLMSLMDLQKVMEMEEQTLVDEPKALATNLSRTARKAMRAPANNKVVTRWYGLRWLRLNQTASRDRLIALEMGL